MLSTLFGGDSWRCLLDNNFSRVEMEEKQRRLEAEWDSASGLMRKTKLEVSKSLNVMFNKIIFINYHHPSKNPNEFESFFLLVHADAVCRLHLG